MKANISQFEALQNTAHSQMGLGGIGVFNDGVENASALRAGATSEGANYDIAENQLKGFLSLQKKTIERQNSVNTGQDLSTLKAKIEQERQTLGPNVTTGLSELNSLLKDAEANNLVPRIKYLTDKRDKIHALCAEIVELDKQLE